VSCCQSQPRAQLGQLGIAPVVILGLQAGITAAGAAIAWLRTRGKDKLQATAYVQQVEPLIAANLEAFLANPSRELQAATLADFDSVWADLRGLCGNPALGDAGRRCISDRDRGGKTDWFGYYRDPVAQYQFPAASTATASGAFAGGPDLETWGAAALIAAGVLIWGAR
jgi:hypothetical protein